MGNNKFIMSDMKKYKQIREAKPNIMEKHS